MSNETIHWFNHKGEMWGVKDVDGSYSLVNKDKEPHEDEALLAKLSDMVGEPEEGEE